MADHDHTLDRRQVVDAERRGWVGGPQAVA